MGALTILTGLVALDLAVGPDPHRGGQRILLALVACAPIVVLRRWPLPVLVVAVAATGTEMGLGNASLPLSVMLGLATYLTASQLPRRLSIRIAVAAAGALGVALVYAGLEASGAPLAVEAVEGFLPLVRGVVCWRQRRGPPSLYRETGRAGRARAGS